jgi:O-antigen/teichoic acid export membrane protein
MERACNGAAMESSSDATKTTQKILRETSHFALIEIAGSILTWGSQIALARLLDRRDFGVFGICLFYIGLGELLGNGGLGATLIRRRTEPSRDEYRSTITSLVALSTALSLALFIAAPALGAKNHFSSHEVNALRAMSPLYLVGALRVVPYVKLERELAFSAIARIEMIARVARHLSAIGIAVFFGSVWALVISQLTAAFVQLVVAYRLAPGWVGLGFSWRVFRPLIAYGSKVQSLSILAYFKDNLSRAMLGSWMGPSAVGIYDFGVSYIQVPVVAVNGLARVQLPVYARIDAQDPTLRVALRGAMRAAVLVGLPFLCGLALACRLLIPLVYGSSWTPAYPVVWALLLNMACGLVLSPLFTLLQGQGRAGLAMIVFSVWTCGTWLLAVGGLLWQNDSLGIVAAAQSAASVCVTAYLLIWASRHLRHNMLDGLLVPTGSAAVALTVGILMERSLHGWLANPITAVFVFSCIYLTGIVCMEGKMATNEIKAIFRSIRSKPRQEEPNLLVTAKPVNSAGSTE